MDTLFEFATRGMRAQAAVDKLCNKPLAHTNDPLTSFKAAEKMVRSGALSEQENQVFGWIKTYLKNHPKKAKDFTAREIAMWRFANKYHVIQRRLSGLRNKGKIGRVRLDGGICCGPKPNTKYLVVREGYCAWRLL